MNLPKKYTTANTVYRRTKSGHTLYNQDETLVLIYIENGDADHFKGSFRKGDTWARALAREAQSNRRFTSPINKKDFSP